MAALDTVNMSAHLNVTPSIKRKRQFHKLEIEDNASKANANNSCFTNAAFSSTPKKILAKRRILLKRNTERENIFPDVGLETKSISEIANQHEIYESPKNPYEVLRKPPKKKKRHAEESACFENGALNLELPDKLFNPYEVVREAPSNKSTNCFSNPALNLKIQDASVLCNPFEVQRIEPNRDVVKLDVQIKAQPLIPLQVNNQQEVTTKPCQFKLGLPFVPRVDCRIDFDDISMSQLTPSKLLAEKLVFSPVPKGKVSVGSAGEETTMDIGKELDRYQLELENSINEAKLRKTGVIIENILLSSPDATCQIQMFDFEKKSKFTHTLCGISEDIENEPSIVETNKHCDQNIQLNVQKEQKLDHNSYNTNPFRCGPEYEKTETAEVIEIENCDEIFWCSADDHDEDSFDFKAPSAPFVRAYTKPSVASTKLTVSKESSEYNISDKSDETDDHIKKSMNVKNIIRKSIRRIIHPHQHSQEQEKKGEDDADTKVEYEKNNGFMNAIRQSLRRKPAKNLEMKDTTKKNDISIIDSTERTMKLKSDVLQTEYVKIEDLTNERKHNLRNSIRKSTREIRNHFSKSIFHKKHEEYNCHK